MTPLVGRQRYLRFPVHVAAVTILAGVSLHLTAASTGLVSLGTVTANSPLALALEPTGRFLYAADAGSGAIRTFQIRANGALISLGAQDAGLRAVSLAVHPSGRFLYCVDAADARLLAFTINAATGDLQLLTSAVSGTTNPIAVAVEPRGRFLYVLNHFDVTIDAFRINLSTGELTRIQTLALPAQATQISGLTIEPTGRFVYVSCVCNTANSRFRAFRINATTGLLTDLGGTGGDGNFLANASAADLTGRFVYMTTFNSNEIESFAINQTTGLLTPLGVTQAVSNGIASLVVDPLGRFMYATTLPGYVHAFRVSAATGAVPSGERLRPRTPDHLVSQTLPS